MSENPDHIQVFKDNLIPVTDREGWFRDPDSNAIVNCNKSAYDQYMASFNKRERKEKQFTSLQTDVDGLKSDISDMKSMLTQLLEKKDAS
jgi:hypothetical protein|tara:strand:- start:1246 stop:1515 length:270 start_codon:yes stop_codon:yes gene_type:complete